MTTLPPLKSATVSRNLSPSRFFFPFSSSPSPLLPTTTTATTTPPDTPPLRSTSPRSPSKAPPPAVKPPPGTSTKPSASPAPPPKKRSKKPTARRPKSSTPTSTPSPNAAREFGEVQPGLRHAQGPAEALRVRHDGDPQRRGVLRPPGGTTPSGMPPPGGAGQPLRLPRSPPRGFPRVRPEPKI